MIPAASQGAVHTAIDDTCSVPGGGLFFAGGPATGWKVHNDPASPGSCHLSNNTTASGVPEQTASYYLPPDQAHNGVYVVDAWINCEHNGARMKYYVYLNGTGAGVSVIVTNGVSSVCDNWARVVASRTYNAQLGAYIKLVDNTGTNNTVQNADLHFYVPN